MALHRKAISSLSLAVVDISQGTTPLWVRLNLAISGFIVLCCLISSLLLLATSSSCRWMVVPVMNSVSIQELKAKYEAHGQGHVFKFFDELTEQEKTAFLSQLAAVPIEKLNQFFQEATEGGGEKDKAGIRPVFKSDVVRMGEDGAAEERWWNLGLEAISQGRVAVVTLAGGQGTRLGSAQPKGCYDIGLPSGKSLFQLQAERLIRLSQLTGTPVPWYIMTSGPTHQNTVDFFQAHSFFGLDSAQIKFFQQGVLPALTLKDGRIFLQTKGSLALSPDGNGGIYAALRAHGILAELEAKGVEYVHMHSVDNCLVRMADPVFVGLCMERGADCASKAVAKTDPKESVGILSRRCSDCKMVVAEYSELDPSLADAVDEEGSLCFNTANIAVHMFSTAFLHAICHDPSLSLPYHVAKKKIPSIDWESGEPMALPPIGIKLEAFIFDVLEHAQNPVILQVERWAEFAPLKNASGSAPEDTPEACRERLFALHKRWLGAAGALVLGEGPCEISPLLSYAGEGLEAYAGATLELPQVMEAVGRARL